MENPSTQSALNEIKRRSSSVERRNPFDGKIRSSENYEEISTDDDQITAKVKSPYTVRKITALGMMDVALLTANANQLRFLCTYNTMSSTYYVSLTLVIVSLVLQICIGIALIFKRQMKNTGRNEHKTKTNNLITIGIFLITVINVFIASFTTIS